MPSAARPRRAAGAAARSSPRSPGPVRRGRTPRGCAAPTPFPDAVPRRRSPTPFPDGPWTQPSVPCVRAPAARTPVRAPSPAPAPARGGPGAVQGPRNGRRVPGTRPRTGSAGLPVPAPPALGPMRTAPRRQAPAVGRGPPGEPVSYAPGRPYGGARPIPRDEGPRPPRRRALVHSGPLRSTPLHCNPLRSGPERPSRRPRTGPPPRPLTGCAHRRVRRRRSASGGRPPAPDGRPSP